MLYSAEDISRRKMMTAFAGVGGAIPFTPASLFTANDTAPGYADIGQFTPPSPPKVQR
jgi:hypothetical protein